MDGGLGLNLSRDAPRRFGSDLTVALLLLSALGAIVVVSPAAAYSKPSFDCSSTSPFGTGAAGNVTISSSTSITSTTDYGNLVIDSGVTVTITSGVTVYVCGTLTNSGTIVSAGSSGSTGGTGANGATGGGEAAVSCTGTGGSNGNPGNGAGGGGAVSCFNAGSNGATGGTGGGKGGNGAAGGTGTAGGTYTFYTWVINNAGSMTAPGGPGGLGGTAGNGGSGTAGSATCSGLSGVGCSAGGGGGGNGGNGGKGGSGGPGGSITEYYGSVTGTGLGSITAPGGSGGSGGSPGSGGSGASGSGASGTTSCTAHSGGSGGGTGGGTTSGCGWTSASSGSSGSTGASGSSGSPGTVSTVHVVLVTLPILVPTPTGATAFTYTASGGSITPTSGSSGTTVDFTIINASTITLTMPAASSGTRTVFASNSTTTSKLIDCATTTCTTWEPADYYQLQNTYGMKPSSSTFDSSYSEPVTGTISGSTGTLLGDIALTGSTTYATLKAWADYDTQACEVSQFAAAGGSAGTWTATSNAPSGTPVWCFTQTTAKNLDNVTYTFYAQATPVKNTFGVTQLIMTNPTSTTTSCSVTLGNVAQGNLLGFWASAGSAFGLPGDTGGTNWVSYASTSNGGYYAEIWLGYIPTYESSDVITVNWSSSSYHACGAYEIQGLQSFTAVKATATGTGTAVATASESFSGTPYIAIAAASNDYGTSTAWTAGTGYSLMPNGATSLGTSEYSTSVSSPTTFPMTTTSGAWAEVAVVISRGIKGADLYLQDSTTGLPFAIGGYAGSTAAVDYGATTPPTYYKLNMSETVVSLYGSSEVQVCVSTSYCQTIIPSLEPNPANVTVYLAPPAVVSAFTLQVNDLSGKFGPGTEAVVYGPGSRIYSAGYTDSSDVYAFDLQPGSYPLILTHGTSTYSTTISLGATGTATVNIFSYQVTGDCGATCTTSWGAHYSASSQTVSITFADSTQATTSITDQLWVNNATLGSPFLIYTRSWTGSWGTFTDIVPCDDDNCNATTVGNAYVVLTYDGATANFPVAGGSLGASIPSFPAAWGGLDLAFPSVPPMDFVSMFILLMAAAGMGAYDAKVGAVVLAVLAIALTAIGWFTGLSGAMLTFLAAIAVMALVAWYRNRY